MKLNIVKWRLAWFTISATAVGLSIFVFFAWGLKQGIDFTGGTEMSLRFQDNRPSVVDLGSALQPLDLGDTVIQPAGTTDMQLRFKTIDEPTHQTILTTIQKDYPGTTELEYNAIGPSIGEELRNKSLQAVIIVFLAILAYIAWQFRRVSAPVESWKYGLVTIMQAFRDVMIPIGVFCVLGHFYGVEIGTPFIAAILTVLGYSITDCIVVLDRIRENLHKKDGAFKDIVEMSIHQTLLRSFNTSMATLLTLFAIYLFGGASLHDFTLTLIIGIAVGTFSSIFVSAPTLVSLQEWSAKRKKNR
ncbi:MAG TPA: protein translocase subunit SecF [Verrucomicrobiae bacterium]|nr:protein translocase subunit SecF [Verrucomicrobiae bacterium]